MCARLIPPIALAALLITVLCTGLAVAGQAGSIPNYTLTTADGLSLILSADGQITSLQIDGDELVSAPAPALWLRDLSDAGQVTEPNLLTNPGFEDGLSGWTQIANSGLDVNVVVSPTHSGDQALAFSNPLTTPHRFAAYASDPVPVTPGRRYRVSAWFRSSIGYATHPTGVPTFLQKDLWREPQRTNGLYVQWLGDGGALLGDPELAVALHANAQHWRLIRRELMVPSDAVQARVAVAARLEGQTLWVDDVALVPAPEPDVPLTGSVEPCPQSRVSNTQSPISNLQTSDSCLVQTAVLPGGLTITLTYTAHDDHIAVHGEVVDTAGRDRVLDVRWGVPVDASGGTWWDDAHTARVITDTRLYANAISAIYDGWLPISLYPYAGISIEQGGGGTQIRDGASDKNPKSEIRNPKSLGLALALPLDRPQLALLAYEGATGRCGATFHLGISPQAVKVGPRAAFDLMLYRFDPAWGFRDVIARHRPLQPQAYTTDLPLYDYAGFEQGWYFTENGVQQALAHDAANVYSAQYIASELPLHIAPSSEPRPTLDQVLEVVSETLESPWPSDAALARAITQSAAVDTNGDWSLKHIGIFSWAPDWWEAAWAANLDPDLEDELASWTLEWRVTPAFTMTTQASARLDGVQIDNFMSTPTFDLRPEALAAADWPLGYTPHTYQPAVHNGFDFREYLAFLRDYLDTEWGADRGITINFWGLGHPNYLAEYIDGFGSEGNLKGNGEGSNWNPEVLDYRRAIAYSRPYMFANQMTGLTASESYTFTRLAMLYGVVAGSGPNAADWEPEAQQIISDTVELVTRYWSAGWEPLTYARADSEAVWIERFGGPEIPGVPPSSYEFLGTQGNSEELGATQAGLFFPVHNRSTLTRTATITIEAVPLGLSSPDTAILADIATGELLPFTVVDGNSVVTLTLGPLDTRVLKVSGCCDFNADAQVDVVDIQMVAAEWGTADPAYDFDGSGMVDVADLTLVAGRWHR